MTTLPQDLRSLPIDRLELSVRSADHLAQAELSTVGELLDREASTLDPRVAREVQELLEDEYGLAWGGTIVVPPYVPPRERAVSRLAIEFDVGEGDSAFIDRIGGRPNAPTPTSPWPLSDSGRPMQFMFQLVGRAGGGELDFGDVTLLQVFADLAGEYYEEGEHIVLVHRAPCPHALETPAGLEASDVQTMRFVEGLDDSILVAEWEDEREEEWSLAHDHAFCSKVWGVPVGANLDLPVEGDEGDELRHVVQMNAIDDWFLWYVFANDDFSETKLVIVRG